MNFPPEVLAFFGTRPSVGSKEQVVPLLSVDDEGLPHVCLLSRAQLVVAGDEIHAVVASTQTKENLRRDGAAAVLVTLGDTVHYCKLRATRIRDAPLVPGGAPVLVAALRLVGHKADSIGIPLEPMTFHATGEIARVEHWKETELLLESSGASC